MPEKRWDVGKGSHVHKIAPSRHNNDGMRARSQPCGNVAAARGDNSRRFPQRGNDGMYRAVLFAGPDVLPCRCDLRGVGLTAQVVHRAFPAGGVPCFRRGCVQRRYKRLHGLFRDIFRDSADGDAGDVSRKKIREFRMTSDMLICTHRRKQCQKTTKTKK